MDIKIKSFKDVSRTYNANLFNNEKEAFNKFLEDTKEEAYSFEILE